MNRKNDLVEVFIADGELEAHVVKGLLESHDIPSLMKPYSSFTANIIVSNSFGKFRILVREQDEALARELLEGESNA